MTNYFQLSNLSTHVDNNFRVLTSGKVRENVEMSGEKLKINNCGIYM